MVLRILAGVSAEAEGLPTVPPHKSWDRFTMMVRQYQTDVTRAKEPLAGGFRS